MTTDTEAVTAFASSGKTPDGREYQVRVYDNGGVAVEIDGKSYAKAAWKWWRIADNLSLETD